MGGTKRQDDSSLNSTECGLTWGEGGQKMQQCLQLQSLWTKLLGCYCHTPHAGVSLLTVIF